MNPMLRCTRIIGVAVAAVVYAAFWATIGLLALPLFWPVILPAIIMCSFMAIRLMRVRTHAVIDAAAAAVRGKLPVAPVLAAAANDEGIAINRAIHRVAVSIQYGFGVGESLAKHAGGLPRRLRSLLAHADQGGHLPATLERVNNELKERQRRVDARSLDLAGLSLATLALCLTAMMFATWLIVPKFVHIFDDMGVELPAITVKLDRYARWMTGQLSPGQLVPGLVYFILVGLLLCIVGVIAKLLGIHGLLDALLWRIPVVHALQRDRGLGDVFHTMRCLIEGGGTLGDALAHAATLNVNAVLRGRVRAMLDAHNAGLTLGDAARAARLPPLAVGMLARAAATASLPDTLRFLETHYDASYSRSAEMLRAACWPCVTCVLGLLVGWFAIGIIQPLVRVIESLTN